MGGLVTVQRFDGSFALVTGATSGIGRATAVRLVAEGATVVGMGRREAELRRTRSLVVDPDRFLPVPVDLMEDAALVRAVATTLELVPRIDVLANIAGAVDRTPASELDPEALQRIFGVNTFAPMLLCREVLPHVTDGSGVIVNVCSTSATQAHPQMSAYAASKAALLSYSLSLAVELRERRIRVVPLSPGGVDTPMVDGSAATLDANWYGRLATLWNQLGAPEDIAAAIAFAASADGGYLNGAELRLDGGARSAL